jgi:hypothetical protein
VRRERWPARTKHEGEAAERCGALENAGEVRRERWPARTEHEGEAAERCGALEKRIGTKGYTACKPIDTRSKGETWHVIKVQSAVFAVAKA